MLVLLPPSLGGHPFSVPHRGDPLAPLAQRAARVLRLAVVHRGRIAVDLVAEEEHHPPLWHNLQPRAVEGGVPALVADQTVGQARRDAPAAPVAAAMALAVAVRPVLVAVVLVVDGVDRLLRTPRRPGVGRTVRGVASAWSRVVCVCMCRACPSFSTSSSYSATSRAKANLRRISRVTTSVSSSKSGTCADGAAWSVTSPEMGPPPLPPARRHVDAVRGAVRGGCALRAGEDHRGSHPRQRQVDHVPLADAAGHWTVADKSRTAPSPHGDAPGGRHALALLVRRKVVHQVDGRRVAQHVHLRGRTRRGDMRCVLRTRHARVCSLAARPSPAAGSAAVAARASPSCSRAASSRARRAA